MHGLSESFIIRSEKGTTLGHPEMKIAIFGQLSGLLAFFFFFNIFTAWTVHVLPHCRYYFLYRIVNPLKQRLSVSGVICFVLL